jgi:hypothetical protein
MAVNVLSKSSAMNAGSDLWIVPQYQQSHWTPLVDWYLNFQIYKYQTKSRAELSEKLQSILSSTEFKYKTDFKNSPSDICMIGSSHLLPNRWVCVIESESTSFSAWLEKAYKISKSLNFPSIRFFLPPGRNASEVTIPNLPDFQKSEVTVVLDS